MNVTTIFVSVKLESVLSKTFVHFKSFQIHILKKSKNDFNFKSVRNYEIENVPLRDSHPSLFQAYPQKDNFHFRH